jgi:prepilin-type N-terminal cleavage/methylation domain-containing protein
MLFNITYNNMLNRAKISTPKRAYPSKGLTVLELVIVVLIISILSAIAVLGLMHSKKKACLTIARHDLRQFFEAEQQYFAEYDAFKGSVGDVISNDPDVPSTFYLEAYSPSKHTYILITKDDPFTAIATQRGVKLIFEYDIETGQITERQ